MTRNDFYLSNVGMQFDGRTDVARDEVEHHLQARYQGIKPNGVDYIFQGRPDHWQLNGVSALGARAVASVGLGFHLLPNRIDVTLEQLADVHDKAMDYITLVDILDMWLKRHKPTVYRESLRTGSDVGRYTVGARTARWSLLVEEVREKLLQGVRITWRVRQDNVLPVWEYLGFYIDYDSYTACCKTAFAACTNSILEPDFFGLGHDKDAYLRKDGPDKGKNDYWGFLAGVSSKILAEAKKQGSMRLCEDSVKFIENELAKGVVREAKKVSQSAATLEKMEKSVILNLG